MSEGSKHCIGVIRNPELLQLYLTEWMNHERTKVGFEVLRNDKFTCRNCKAVSRPSRQRPDGYMLPIDLNHPVFAVERATLSTAITLCPVCVAASSINNSLYLDPPLGKLIYAPSFTQGEISLIAIYCGAIMIGASEGSLYRRMATDIYASFESLHDELQTKEMSYAGSNDSEFSLFMSHLPQDLYEQRHKVIGAIKFWPLQDRFEGFYDYIYHASLKHKNKEMELAIESYASKIKGGKSHEN